jgi:hypothetical protein
MPRRVSKEVKEKRDWSKREFARGVKNKGIAPRLCCPSVYMYIIIV